MSQWSDTMRAGRILVLNNFHLLSHSGDMGISDTFQNILLRRNWRTITKTPFEIAFRKHLSNIKIYFFVSPSHKQEAIEMLIL